MNKNTAALILGLNPEDFTSAEARDHLEDQIFDHVTFFARRSFLPRLASAKITRLEELREVNQILELGLDKINRREIEKGDELILFPKADDLVKLIRMYQVEEARIKMNLANTSSLESSITLYQMWIDLFNDYASLFITMYESSAFAKSPEDVKISAQIDVMLLMDELNSDQKEKPTIHLEYSRLKKITAS